MKPDLTQAQQHQIILENLQRLLFRTAFTPQEFQAAADMMQFVDGLKAQADAAVEAEQPAFVETPEMSTP